MGIFPDSFTWEHLRQLAIAYRQWGQLNMADICQCESDRLRREEEAKPTLTELLKAAKEHVWTQSEKKEQIESFAYGNVNLSNPTVTKELISSVLREDGR